MLLDILHARSSVVRATVRQLWRDAWDHAQLLTTLAVYMVAACVVSLASVSATRDVACWLAALSLGYACWRVALSQEEPA